MPSFVLTDKGLEYWERLLESDIFDDDMPVEGTAQMSKLRDYTTLEMAREEVLDNTGLMVTSRTYRPIIRRLFEEGYIEYA